LVGAGSVGAVDRFVHGAFAVTRYLSAERDSVSEAGVFEVVEFAEGYRAPLYGV